MHKREYRHNEPEQVRLYLEAALELVDALDPPEDLREPCFTKAVDLLAAKTVQFEQAAMQLPAMAIPGQRR
jgi:hypothetical protein